jgi:O-antigen/teichoic acid export membrane protein
MSGVLPADTRVAPGRRLRLRKSLTVNAMSLMTASVVANGLGLVFWAAAAHLEPPAAVGRASAGIAALTLLSMIAQLNLTNVFIRLVPAAGRLGALLIRRGYLVVVGLSFAAGLVYATTGLSAHVLTGGWTSRALFILAVPVLSVFALEDSVLTALRLAPWVAAENVSAAVARIALLPLLGVAWLSGGTIAAWVLPAAAAAVVVNSLLFSRALPALATVDGTLPGRRRLLSFVAGEFAGNVCFAVSVQVIPLLVVWRLGAAQAAYLTMPWLIATGITLVMWNVAASFEVEAASGRGHPGALLRRCLLLWGAIAAAATAICVLGARPLLELVGARYAAHGVVLLRLIGLSAPFSALVVLFCALAWLDQRIWMLAGFQAGVGAVLIGTTVVLLPRLGLTAAGWAYLAAQALSAAAAAPFALRRMRQYLRRGELAGTR